MGNFELFQSKLSIAENLKKKIIFHKISICRHASVRYKIITTTQNNNIIIALKNLKGYFSIEGFGGHEMNE